MLLLQKLISAACSLGHGSVVVAIFDFFGQTFENHPTAVLHVFKKIEVKK